MLREPACKIPRAQTSSAEWKAIIIKMIDSPCAFAAMKVCAVREVYCDWNVLTKRLRVDKHAAGQTLMRGSHLKLWLVCVDHPSMLHHALTLYFFTIHLFFLFILPMLCSCWMPGEPRFVPMFAPLLRAQHRVTFSVAYIFQAPGNPFAPYNSPLL